MTSEKIDLLVKALLKARGEFKPVVKNHENPFFKSKYADLGAIHEVIEGPLKNNGLVLVHTLDGGAEGSALKTTLFHESGQYITGRYPLNPTKNDPQALGSAVTYARRYATSALLGIVADDDDDGNAATEPRAETKPAAKSTAQPAPSNPGTLITEGQGRRLYAIWKNAKREDSEVREYIKATYGFNSTKEITKDAYEAIVKWVESGAPFPGPDAEIEETPF